jgi:hypothetical protein
LEGNGARTEGAKLYPEHDDARDHDQSPNEFAGQEAPSIEVPQRIAPGKFELCHSRSAVERCFT